MSKREEFKAALKESLKNKDKVKMATVRLITAALKDRDIDARAKGNMDGIGEADILSMLQSMIKQRRDSIKMYEDAGRVELAAQEQAEIDVIESFLPAQLSEGEVQAEIDKLVDELGATEIRDMGKVMGALKDRFAGQIDMGRAGALVKARLAA